MTDSRHREAFGEAVREVSRVFAGYFERLEELSEEVLAVHRAAADADGVLTESALGVVRQRAEGWLEVADAALGYGYVAAPGAVDARERCMLWFQRTGTGVRRLVLNFDPDDIDVYDYLDMEWFTQARDRRTPEMFGPYVDYSGSDQFVVTLSVPVLDGDRFLGVTGCDLLAAGLEAVVVPALRQVPVQTVVVDAERRVAFSNTPRWIQGDRLAKHPLVDPQGFSWVSELLPDVGWVAACDPEHSP